MFGQVVIGLANSGKSTYCKTIGEHLKSQGRKVKLINLDPGVRNVSYECDIDIRELVCVEGIMEEQNLGPNESMVVAAEFMLDHIQWLENKLALLNNDSYLIMDLPGQVELYSHYDYIPRMLAHLTNPKGHNHRFTTVFLAESCYCQSPQSYITILFATLSSMLTIALPQVNILSKSSILARDKLPFNVEHFLEVQHLDCLVDYISTRSGSKMRKMYQKLVDIIIDLPWLGFSLFDALDEESIKDVVSQVDMANGYVVQQQFETLIDEKHQKAEKELDKAADELVDKFF